MPTENAQSITLQIQLEGNAKENQKQEQKSNELLETLLEFLFGKGEEQSKIKVTVLDGKGGEREMSMAESIEYKIKKFMDLPKELMNSVFGEHSQQPKVKFTFLDEKGWERNVKDYEFKTLDRNPNEQQSDSMFNMPSENKNLIDLIFNKQDGKVTCIVSTRDANGFDIILSASVNGKQIDLKSEECKALLKPLNFNIKPTQEKTPEVKTPQQEKNKSQSNSTQAKRQQSQNAASKPKKPLKKPLNITMSNISSMSSFSVSKTPSVNKSKTMG